MTLDRDILILGAVVVLGMLTSILDITIVNVAVPTLTTTFATSITTVQWVMTAYMLAFASVIPLAGWATERFGAKRVWLASLVLFMLGSVCAGLAPSIGWLIGFRVVQGLGGGMIPPVGQTILAQAAGPERMGRVMSVIGVPMLLGPVLGPILGGAIIGAASWRWVFFVNLPLGAIAVLAAQRLLPDSGPRHGLRLDARGLALLSPGIALFLYGVSQMRGLAVVAGLGLLTLFVAHSMARGKKALIDVALFRRRDFAAAAATNFLLGVALFGALILLPLYYQFVRGAGALETGLLLVPQGVGAALAMPVAGRLTDRIGARVVVLCGGGAALAGTLSYTQVETNTSYATLAVALLVIGFGLGSTIMPSMAAAFACLSREEMPRATSALNTIQRLAGAIGTAVLALVLQRSLDGHRADAAAAFGTTFAVAAALIVLAFVPALLLPRRRAAAAPHAAAEGGAA
ncbi:MAG: DHA2 family efflux MFS transporter permease subunit [Gaiellaceae bacterium]